MKKIKTAMGGFMEATIGGIPCVLISGRWVRISDHMPYDEAKRKGL